jgi:peptidyl-tRNA hydrolase
VDAPQPGLHARRLLARQSNALVKRAECRALVGRAELEGRAVELVKPQTYMNLSGESVACLAKKREGFKPAERPRRHQRRHRAALRLDPASAARFERRAEGLEEHHQRARHGRVHKRLRVGIKPEHPVGDTAGFVLERFPRRSARRSKRFWSAAPTRCAPSYATALTRQCRCTTVSWSMVNSKWSIEKPFTIYHSPFTNSFLLASTVTVEARHPKGGWFWQRREFTRSSSSSTPHAGR